MSMFWAMACARSALMAGVSAWSPALLALPPQAASTNPSSSPSAVRMTMRRIFLSLPGPRPSRRGLGCHRLRRSQPRSAWPQAAGTTGAVWPWFLGTTERRSAPPSQWSSRSCRATWSGNQGGLEIATAGGADRRSAKTAGPPKARPLHSPEGGHDCLTLQVIADYTRLNAVHAAGRAGQGRASGSQDPGVMDIPAWPVDTLLPDPLWQRIRPLLPLPAVPHARWRPPHRARPARRSVAGGGP